MTLSNVSTSYLNSALLPSVRSAQSQLATLEVESTTGQYADLGLQLGTQSGYELSLRAQDDLLQTLTTANAIATTNLSSAQSALTAIQTAAQSTAQGLVNWSPDSSSSIPLQSTGQAQLQQLQSLGNATGTGGYLFAGQNSSTPPFSDFYAAPTSAAKSALDATFQSYFGFPATSASQVAGITASQLQGFLSGPFAAEFTGQNWTSNWSSASSVNSSTQISPRNTVDTTTSANSAGFQLLAQGYAMLSEFGGIGLSAGAQKALAATAEVTISDGGTAITNQASVIGETQSAISQADDEMKGQMTILQQQLAKSDSVDGATIATELTTLTGQLEAAYQLTAKINSLNLAQYLPA